jgi:ArsR family metal-binding transcriptional regulator
MDGYRMISLHPRRITVAKADDVIDAWRVLEFVRYQANLVWGRRASIEPSYQMRRRPPALEIFRRLPRTNCRLCGEATCLAFALEVWQGRRPIGDCRPVFTGDSNESAQALLEICGGLGLN